MRNQRKLLIDQLDQRLKPLTEFGKNPLPPSGWIHYLRKALNMTLEQLGNRLNITKQGVKGLEKREQSESISIKSLKEVGKALEMDFVYGFVPIHGSVENFVDLRARRLAKKIVLRTNQNMQLENQGNSEDRINKAIDELAGEIKREMRRSLWD